ncbi:MAG: co-chaperone GroES [Clostridia bacterium]|nr:co-chaperone GroES [Clostridia bacterium]
MKITPLFDKVVVEVCEAEETTKSGFILPSASKEKQQIADVISVGPGGIIDGKEIVMQVKPGDKVLFAKYTGTEFKIDGKTLTIIRQSDILAIVE